MTNYRDLERHFSAMLGLARRPVAIASVQQIPTDITKFEGSVPSGCTFWRLAAEGRTFYTVPSDHYNCAIGCHTHNIPLPSERQAELTGTLGLMVDIGYLRMEEVPGIPRLPATPEAIIYAPLGDTPVEPDVVVFAAPAGRVMLLQEAAIRAGVAAQMSTLGRPTCMAVPAAMALGTNHARRPLSGEVGVGWDNGVAVPAPPIVYTVPVWTIPPIPELSVPSRSPDWARCHRGIRAGESAFRESRLRTIHGSKARIKPRVLVRMR